MIGTLKPTVKSNLSFEYGNPISKVELNRFYPWLNHLRGIPQTLSGKAEYSDNYFYITYLPIKSYPSTKFIMVCCLVTFPNDQ